MVAPQPTLGNSQKDSLTNPMLIMAFYLFQLEGHHEPRNEVESLSAAKHLAGFEPVNLVVVPESENCLNFLVR